MQSKETEAISLFDLYFVSKLSTTEGLFLILHQNK